VTVEQATGLLVAVTGLVGAVGVLVVQLRSLRKDLNGRLTQLLAVAEQAARKDGELAGRDFSTRSTTVSAPVGVGTVVPLTPNE